MALLAQLRKQRDQFLSLAAVARSEDGVAAQIVLVGLPGAFGGDGQWNAEAEHFADQVLGRENAAGPLAGQEKLARRLNDLGRLLGSLEIETPYNSRGLQHLTDQGELGVFRVVGVHTSLS